MGLGSGFSDKSGQSYVDTMRHEDVIAAISDFPTEMRPRLGIPDDDTESQQWRDFTGTGHLYVRGALASLERIAKGEHDADAAGAALGTVMFAGKSPDKFFGSTVENTAGIAKKVLQAELAGETDLAKIITTDELQTVLSGLTDAYREIETIAAQEDAPSDLQVYEKALRKATEHFNSYGASLNSTIDPNFYDGFEKT